MIDVSRYVPHFGMIQGKKWTRADVAELQQFIADHGSTHVEDTSGRVWKMHAWMNAKSVPVTTTHPTKTRIPFSQVRSFGALRDDE